MSILDIHKCECKKVKDIIKNGNNLDKMSLFSFTNYRRY